MRFHFLGKLQQSDKMTKMINFPPKDKNDKRNDYFAGEKNSCIFLELLIFLHFFCHFSINFQSFEKTAPKSPKMTLSPSNDKKMANNVTI